jgi:2-polyprenyl-3-methyl-5-hydroxy-6-metoxy-1,4-benzoquinol methylase
MSQPQGYYDTLNHDLLARLPQDARRVVEVGCGGGALARAYRHRNPGAHYTGVELAEAAARRAAGACHEVVLGDIQSPACLQALDRLRAGAGWDLVVCGDVLEHLLDPLRVLAELRLRTISGGICVACIPNIGHVSIVQQLLRAQWNYADAGLLDRTHLRFFTQPTMVELFRQAGWRVNECTARVFDPAATAQAIAPLLALAPALGLEPAAMEMHLAAYQWIVRAENPG